jgi:excisionase family DNA binding protein
MGVSQLKIPKICEQCGEPFEAKTVITRFCSHACGNKSGKEKKRLIKEAEQKQTLLKESAKQIAEMQARPYISITEATILFGISKDTIRRLVKSGKVPAINFGERLTRVSRSHIEEMFTAVEISEMPEKKKKQSVKLYNLELEDCYTIGEISKKFGISESSVHKHIRKYSIPIRQIGNYVYAPKSEIDKLYNKQ